MRKFEKDVLDKEKSKKITLIKEYDKSEGVNSFTLNGKHAWLDKATRVGLVNSMTIEKGAGRTETELWLNGEMFKFNIDDVLKMLAVVELYAKECYNVTEQHIANVMEMTDVNRIWNYNYTKGYPERVRFDL